MTNLPKPTKPYKSVNNIWYTSSLFYEQWVLRNPAQRVIAPVFTLYDSTKPDLVCFRTTFVDENDPTGYKWAIKYLGDWEHWEKLVRYPWFREALEKARQEIYIKNRADALEVIKNIALGGDSKQALPAARYLAELENNLNKAPAGRPTNAKVEAETRKLAEALSVEDEDAERIGLTVINGGRK